MSGKRKNPPGTVGSKTILLAVSGMSPAILTETVWALAHDPPRIIPDEVIVLTTTTGARDIETKLLASSADWDDSSVWITLRRAVLGVRAEHSSALQLATPRVIEIPDTRRGVKRPAADLRTPEDNVAAADFILEEVRRLTENPDVRVIASIAGGRKTMGALLYAAMSLLGRETDRLTHVLVSDPYDRCRDFFYPDQPVNPTAPPPASGRLPASNARIDLADIPFVPLRNLFQKERRRLPGSFAALVAEASRRIPPGMPAQVRVREDTPVIELDGQEIRFSARDYPMVLLLAQRCIDKRPPFPDHAHAHGAYQKLIQKLRAEAQPDNFGDWRGNIPITTESADLRKTLSNIRTQLKKAGGSALRLAAALLSQRGVAFQVPPETFKIKK